jgi:hypothetical protein
MLITQRSSDRQYFDRDAEVEPVLPAALLRVWDQLTGSTPVVVELQTARSRIAAGLVGFDPGEVLHASHALGPAFAAAMDALEGGGAVSTTLAGTLRASAPEIRSLAQEWVSGEPTGAGAGARAGRLAVSVAAGAILTAQAAAVTGGERIEGWKRPSACPCCGGSADLAVSNGVERGLVCSRCNAVWRARAGGCVACPRGKEGSVDRIPAHLAGYTIIVCNSCGRYLKESEGRLRHHPLVERALMAQIDRAAEKRGLRF